MVDNQTQMMTEMFDMFKDFMQQASKSGRKDAVDNLQPLTDEDLSNCLASLSLDFVKRGAKGFADFAGNYPFKDKVIFTDRSRQKLQYKNEDGTINADGRALALRFFNAILEKNSALLKKEYSNLHKKVQDIVDAGTAGKEDVSEILYQASQVQDILIKTKNAADGHDEEFIQEFLRHLSKTLKDRKSF